MHYLECFQLESQLKHRLTWFSLKHLPHLCLTAFNLKEAGSLCSLIRCEDRIVIKVDLVEAKMHGSALEIALI